MGAFVEDPIKPGAVGQGAQPAVAALVNRPEGQVNGPAFVVQGIAACRLRVWRVVLQQRIVGIRHPQLKRAAPLGLHQVI